MQLPWVSVTVVDNASPDDSAAVVADLPLRTIRAPRNGGFAYGCNLGTAAGTAEFVLFLNPDARITPASLGALVGALRADPALGGVGPRTLGDGGQLQLTQRRFPRLRSTYSQALGLHHVAPRASWASEVIKEPAAYARPATPDWLSGSCMLIRRAAIDDVGEWMRVSSCTRRRRTCSAACATGGGGPVLSRGPRRTTRATDRRPGRRSPQSWLRAGSATRASTTVRWSPFWRQSAWRSTLSRVPPSGSTVRRADADISQPRGLRWAPSVPRGARMESPRPLLDECRHLHPTPR